MDNEEIRKLLQELKESSDESSAVRSRIVKIHMDTPAEADRRRRAKEKEEERAARKAAEEKARKEAEEEKRRLEAERAAQEVVEEAKREAKAGFAADLDEDILSSDAASQADDAPHPTAADLDLSWEYEKPELTSGFARDEDFVGAERKKSSAGESGESAEEFDLDAQDFRSSDDMDENDPGPGSITGLPGLFGALSDKALSFAGGIRRSMKEDLAKTRGSNKSREAGAGISGGGEDAASDKPTVDGGEDANGFAPGSAAEAAASEDGSKAGEDEASGGGTMAHEAGPEQAADSMEQNPRREYGPDEEWKLRLEETPKKKSPLSRLRTRISLTAGDMRAQWEKRKEDKGEKKQSSDVRPVKASSDVPQNDISQDNSSRNNISQNNSSRSDISQSNSSRSDISQDDISQSDIFQNDNPQNDIPQSIEVIDLNENQNNKEAEVIPLVGNTGPLPDPAQLKRAGAGKLRTKHVRIGHGFGEQIKKYKKQLVIAVLIAAVCAAAAAIIFVISGRMDKTRRAVIEADEGLSVSVLEQPDRYTAEGDVKIRVKAPETIQSISVNGENVVVTQGRSVEFTYHAAGGTLDVMAVSTDKVRNAKVILAYVDSQPPTVTIREDGGKIVFDAKDTESGLKALYIGEIKGTSQIPQYEEYSQPLKADPDREVTYYAVDQAGNATSPVTVALTPADSIKFDRERYGLFPGSEQKVQLVTTPEKAFVNNLTLEAENPKIVQIESGTVLKGMAEGDTKITATADGIPGVEAGVSVASERKVKISAVGDCTLGTDESFSQNTSFNAFEALYGDSYFFEKVKGILSSDDSTFANFEGTLTTSDQREQKQFAFKGDPSYTRILQEGSIDVVNLANNHSKDYGPQSLTDTQKALEDAGIEWCQGDHIAWRDVNGVRIAYIGIYALENGLETLPQVKSTIAEAKEKGADLIVVEFHWGAELVAEIDSYQSELAHTAVDEGANLVLGSHAHVLQGIEKYKGVYIVYGLGNFCFGGSANPTSYDTIIWQQTFTLNSDGLESEDDIAIIPCRVSSETGSNNYQPVPVSGEEASSIMQTIDSLSSAFGQSYSQYMVDGTLWTDSGN